jgi:hypothetical protein
VEGKKKRFKVVLRHQKRISGFLLVTDDFSCLLKLRKKGLKVAFFVTKIFKLKIKKITRDKLSIEKKFVHEHKVSRRFSIKF